MFTKSDTEAVARISNAKLDEFKNRLRRTVERTTCDLKTDEEMKAYVATLTVVGLCDLIYVLNGELHQLKQAVLEQK